MIDATKTTRSKIGEMSRSAAAQRRSAANVKYVGKVADMRVKKRLGIAF